MVATSLAPPWSVDAVGGWVVPVGCPVFDVDGEKVGTVAGADAAGLVVERALFWRYSVPLNAVADFDGEALRLAVTKEAVRRGEWDAVTLSGSGRVEADA